MAVQPWCLVLVDFLFGVSRASRRHGEVASAAAICLGRYMCLSLRVVPRRCSSPARIRGSKLSVTCCLIERWAARLRGTHSLSGIPCSTGWRVRVAGTDSHPKRTCRGAYRRGSTVACTRTARSSIRPRRIQLFIVVRARPNAGELNVRRTTVERRSITALAWAVVSPRHFASTPMDSAFSMSAKASGSGHTDPQGRFPPSSVLRPPVGSAPRLSRVGGRWWQAMRRHSPWRIKRCRSSPDDEVDLLKYVFGLSSCTRLRAGRSGATSPRSHRTGSRAPSSRHARFETTTRPIGPAHLNLRRHSSSA
jgi:hypothetical protein